MSFAHVFTSGYNYHLIEESLQIVLHILLKNISFIRFFYHHDTESAINDFKLVRLCFRVKLYTGIAFEKSDDFIKEEER